MPHAVLERRCPSGLDRVHELAAAGAAHATTVIAEEQTAGRGRDGRPWHSAWGGAWVSMLLRPRVAPESGAVSLRAGLVVADAVDELVGAARAHLKWPNDVLLDDRKLGGILCEGRWQRGALQWLALGVGVNVCNALAPELAGQAATLAEILPEVRRLDLLDRLVPGLAALGSGPATLTEKECAAFAARDWLAGRAVRLPVAGRAAGIRADGALLVRQTGGGMAVVQDGHVVLA